MHIPRTPVTGDSHGVERNQKRRERRSLARERRRLLKQKEKSCDELGDTYSEKVVQAETQSLSTEFEQLELISKKVDSETHSEQQQQQQKPHDLAWQRRWAGTPMRFHKSSCDELEDTQAETQRPLTELEQLGLSSKEVDSGTHSGLVRRERDIWANRPRTLDKSSCDELGDTDSEKVVQAETERLLTELEQLKLISKEVNSDTHSQEDSTMRQWETKEQRVARNKREFQLPQNRIKVARLRDNGIIGYTLIPTQSFWLRMCCQEWGTTDEETKIVIKDLPGRHIFRIEICGSNVGFGVILRDSMRSPIVAISRVLDNCVSPFYHELQGLSLGLNLAVKYRIIYLNIICISERLASYIMESWDWMGLYCCPQSPMEKEKYCVDCAKRKLAQMGESKNAEKILQLTGEIFSIALEFLREGFHQFHLEPATKLLSTKAAQHLANSGLNQELRLPEIQKDEEIAEIFYKEVYRHGSAEELMLQKQQLELQRLGLH